MQGPVPGRCRAVLCSPTGFRRNPFVFLSSSDLPVGEHGASSTGTATSAPGRDGPGACRWRTLPSCSRGRQKLSLRSGFGFRNASWSTLNLFKRDCLSSGLVEPLMDCRVNCTSYMTEHRMLWLLREQFGSVDSWRLGKNYLQPH